MKKTFDILLILLAILIVGFVGFTLFGVLIVQTKSNDKFFEDNKLSHSESRYDRILYSYGLDTLNLQNYVLKRKVKMILKKTERDSTITFQLVDTNDTLNNYGFTQYAKYDKSIYIVGQKHEIIESKRYINKEISNIAFDLYDAVDPPTDWNGPFLFNLTYGVLNIEAWSSGRKVLILPTNYNRNIKAELLNKNINVQQNER